MKFLLGLILLSTLTGCVAKYNALQARNYSAGKIGCLPSEITISDDQASALTATRTWVAACKGKEYICTSVTTSNTRERKSERDISCTPRQ